MKPTADYKFEYISPTILRGDDEHAFLLFYSDSLGKIEFDGYEPGHASGGTIHVLSQEDWDAFYPARKGQRALILQRLTEYSRSHPHLHFIERSLQRRPILRRLGWVLALTATGVALGFLPVWPWLPPWEYAALMWRQDPVRWTARIVFGTAVLLSFFYFYRYQRVPPILNALGSSWIRPPARTFALAAAGLLLVGLLSLSTTKIDTAREAIRRAEQQYGPEYDYIVLSIDGRGSKVAALVLAYNEREMRQIELEWQRE